MGRHICSGSAGLVFCRLEEIKAGFVVTLSIAGISFVAQCLITHEDLDSAKNPKSLCESNIEETFETFLTAVTMALPTNGSCH